MTSDQFARLAFHQVWQLTLLIPVVGCVVRAAGRDRPFLSHVLWLVVLCKCVTPPLWSSSAGVFCWLLPASASEHVAAGARSQAALMGDGKLPAISIKPGSTFQSETADSGAGDDVTGSETSLITVNVASAGQVIADHEQVDGEFCGIAPSAGAPINASDFTGRRKATDAGWTRWLLAVWVVGSIACASGLTWRWLSCRRRLRLATEVEHPGVVALVSRLKQQLGIRCDVRVLVTRAGIGPAVFGIRRPLILLPWSVVEGRSDAELEPIIAHELLHVRRGDLLIGLLQVLSCIVWWFHPLVWIVSRLVSREAERCCDEAVLAELQCSAGNYARCLLNVLELKQVLKPVPVFPGVRPVEVTSQRLERIMRLGHGSRSKSPWWCWAVMLIGVVITLPGAALVSAEDPSDASSKAEQRASQELEPESKQPKLGTTVIGVSSDGQSTFVGEIVFDKRTRSTNVTKSTGTVQAAPKAMKKIKSDGVVEKPIEKQEGNLPKSGAKYSFGPMQVQIRSAQGKDATVVTRRRLNLADGTLERIRQVKGGARVSVTLADHNGQSIKYSINATNVEFSGSKKESTSVLSVEFNDRVQATFDKVWVTADAAKVRFRAKHATGTKKPAMDVDLLFSGRVQLRRVDGKQLDEIAASELRLMLPSNHVQLISADGFTKSQELAINADGTLQAEVGWDRDKARRRNVPKSPEARTKAALAKLCSVQFESTPFVDAMRHLADVGGLNINVDSAGAKSAGLNLRRPVSLSVEGVKMSSALTLLLDGTGMAWQVDGEVVTVTDAKSVRLVTMVYPVADLVVPVPRTAEVSVSPPRRDPREWQATADKAPIGVVHKPLPRSEAPKVPKVDMAPLIELIQLNVAPKSWNASGGVGTIRPYHATLSLVIRNSPQAHNEIGELLTQLRRIQDVQITVAVKALQIPAEQVDKFILQAKQVNDPATKRRIMRQIATMLKHVDPEDARVLSSPKVTLFNGQGLALTLPASSRPGAPHVQLHVVLTASADRRRVDMKYSIGAKDPLDALVKSTSTSVLDNEELVIDVTPIPRPAIAGVPAGIKTHTRPKTRTMLIVTPSIIIQEEEEELLNLDKNPEE